MKTKINKKGRLEIVHKHSSLHEILNIFLILALFAMLMYCFVNPQKNFEKYCTYHAHENNINCLLSKNY